MNRGLPTDVILRKICVAASESARNAIIATMYRLARDPFRFGGLVKLESSLIMKILEAYYREKLRRLKGPKSGRASVNQHSAVDGNAAKD
jgi:hypothetical protein